MMFGTRGECVECGREIGLIAGEHGSVLRKHIDVDGDGDTCPGSGKHPKGEEPPALDYAPGF